MRSELIRWMLAELFNLALCFTRLLSGKGLFRLLEVLIPEFGCETMAALDGVKGCYRTASTSYSSANGTAGGGDYEARNNLYNAWGPTKTSRGS